ncbi:HNH endonuclease [Novosphingobium huizhouense]|uniref:HNH endonuclease n=1 Tax=Novosphingobium huizhouense TaxID=2866625 RepID=UPI001CD8630C|nr:HNH endonuclease [Novosphingobium huizhouense]
MDEDVGAKDVRRLCWLCTRPLGRKVEWHHPVPKSRGGRETEPVHPICHRTLHATFSNAELARFGGDPEHLRARGELAPFLRWIAGKPADFHAPTARRKG